MLRNSLGTLSACVLSLGQAYASGFVDDSHADLVMRNYYFDRNYINATPQAAAREWAAHTGRTVIVRVTGSDCHKLPDHHQRSGDAWWIDHDVTEWAPVYARAELRHWSAP